MPTSGSHRSCFPDHRPASAAHHRPDPAAQAAHTPTIAPLAGGGWGGEQVPPCALQLPKATSSLSEGPLAMGVASSFKTRDPFAQQLSLKEQHNPLAASTASVAGMARSSSGNPFSSEVGGEGGGGLCVG